MKKTYSAGLAFLVGLLMIAVGAHAEAVRFPGNPGGFTGPGPEPVTVQEALKRPDETPVVLEGYLVKSLGSEHYEFKDDTGALTVEISDKLWQGRQISPEAKIRLEGEVERDWPKGFKVDVDKLSVL